MRDRGCTRVASVHDNEVYGRGMADLDAPATHAARPADRRATADRPPHAPASARDRAGEADCVAYTGITANGAVRAVPRVGARRAARSCSQRRRRRVRLHPPCPASSRRRMIVTVATLAPDAYARPHASSAAPRPVQDLRLRGDEADPRRHQRRRADQGRACWLPARRPEPRERARHLQLRRQRRHDAADVRPLQHPRPRRCAGSAPITAG